jgi:oxygen-dependent protoporphyrinogen oxidase
MRGKVRAVADLWKRPRREETDEAMGSLLRRRLGREVAELMVGPLLEGLFACEMDRMSVLATFPELGIWERKHGSLIRGARAATRSSEKRAREPMFLRPRGGTERIPQVLSEAVGFERIRLDSPASSVSRNGGGFVVRTDSDRLEADAVVVAAPSFEASRLLSDVAPGSAQGLEAIRYASTGVVFLVYGDGSAERLPEGTGFLVPRGKAPMTACTWISSKWPDPSFGTRAVMRCYVGGAGLEDVLDGSDGDIVEAVERHLAAVLPLPTHAESTGVVRWVRAMPQYEVGHLERVAAIESALPPGLFVTGQAYRGAGIADTVRQAEEAAQRVRGHLGIPTAPEQSTATR